MFGAQFINTDYALFPLWWMLMNYLTIGQHLWMSARFYFCKLWSFSQLLGVRHKRTLVQHPHGKRNRSNWSIDDISCPWSRSSTCPSLPPPPGPLNPQVKNRKSQYLKIHKSWCNIPDIHASAIPTPEIPNPGISNPEICNSVIQTSNHQQLNIQKQRILKSKYEGVLKSRNHIYTSRNPQTQRFQMQKSDIQK